MPDACSATGILPYAIHVVDKGAIWFTHQELARARAERVKQRDGTRVQDL